MHWKKLMDPKEFLFAHDLDGRDVTVEFEHVTGGELSGDQGRKTKKPIAKIKGKPKKLALNSTNCKVIEALYGTPDTDKWAGIRVTLYPTTTSFGGQTMDCIRIRPTLPKARGDAPKSDAKGKDVRALSDQIAEKMTESPASGYDPENAASESGPDDDIPGGDDV